MRYNDTNAVLSSDTATKISSAAFKQQVVSFDMFTASFLKDNDLFYLGHASEPQEIIDMDAFWKETEEFVKDPPYCLPYALNPGEMNSRRYEYKGKFIEYRPSQTGLPTIRDMDILLYCESWIGNAALEGREDDINNHLEFEIEDFYTFANRARRADRDEAFIQALNRLAGSTITTNTKPFGQDSESKPVQYIWDYKLKYDESGKIKTVLLRIPYRICYLMEGMILDIFDKRFIELSPVRRALYMFLTHYCPAGWEDPCVYSYSKLHQVTGATSPLWSFKKSLVELARDPLPNYEATIDEANETITFVRVD